MNRPEKTAARTFMQFQRATNDLNTLIGHVGAFVDWWGEMGASLRNLKERLPMVKLDGSNPYRTSTAAEKWKGIRTECYNYQQQVLVGPLVV